MTLSKIQEQWTEQRCPIINGILFASGRIAWINVDEKFDGGSLYYALDQPSETSITELIEEGELQWTDLTILKELSSEGSNLLVQIGEGAMGGDGFVATSDRASKKLLWLAFFENSNPFVDVEITDDVIQVQNNHSISWRFPITTPEKVCVGTASRAIRGT